MQNNINARRWRMKTAEDRIDILTNATLEILKPILSRTGGTVTFNLSQYTVHHPRGEYLSRGEIQGREDSLKRMVKLLWGMVANDGNLDITFEVKPPLSLEIISKNDVMKHIESKLK